MAPLLTAPVRTEMLTGQDDALATVEVERRLELEAWDQPIERHGPGQELW